MKHYFVDTNVVIDMLADREGYADAACELFDAAGRGEVHLSICALSYSTIYYILRKYAGKENAISSLRDLTDYVSILPVDAEVIRKALYSEFSDYEDAIQHYAALQDASVEGIITRNIKVCWTNKASEPLSGNHSDGGFCLWADFRFSLLHFVLRKIRV